MFSSRLNFRLAHLDEAGDVCGVVAGVGVLVPVHGVHGLTAAPTLATAWLEAAGPGTGRGALGTAATSRTPSLQPGDGFMRGGEWRNKSQIVLNMISISCMMNTLPLYRIKYLLNYLLYPCRVHTVFR